MRFWILVGMVCGMVLGGGTVVAAPIHDAVVSRNISSINQLIAQGVNVNELDEFGFAPLHWAVRDNQVEIVRILIEAGADVNIVTGSQDGGENTPLHYAVGEDNEELLRLLLSNGADINAPDSSGNTPLHIAALLCSPVSVSNIIQLDGNQRRNNNAGKAPGELTPDVCVLPVRLYNPNALPPLAQADDTYIPGIHGLRGLGLWGGAALVSPSIFVIISSTVNQNFGDDVIFADTILDDLVFGGMIAGTTSILFTALETAFNVDSHHLFGISWTYTALAGAFTATTVVFALTNGLPFMSLVPAVWYGLLGITGWVIQLEARQQTTHRIAEDASDMTGNDTPRDTTQNAQIDGAGSYKWRPTVLFSGNQIIVRY